MSTDLAVIEAALKAATPGPWEASADNAVPDRAAILTAWCYEGEDAELVTDWCTLPDAHLIANAPTWLAELVERVRLLEGAIDGIRSSARTDRFACCACCLEDHDADSELVNNHTLPCNICQDPWKARSEAAEAAIERVRSEVLTKERDRRAELWRERNALAERCSELDTEVHLMRARIRRLEGGPDA